MAVESWGVAERALKGRKAGPTVTSSGLAYGQPLKSNVEAVKKPPYPDWAEMI